MTALADNLELGIDRSGGPDACHPWTRCRNRNGYGLVNVNRVARLVHRLVLEQVAGPAPAAAPFALHSCDNPPCCNPRHLRWGSRLGNAADARDRGQQPRGERHGNAVLTDEQVAAIRQARSLGAPLLALASDYGVCKQQISRIARGERWRALDVTP